MFSLCVVPYPPSAVNISGSEYNNPANDTLGGGDGSSEGSAADMKIPSSEPWDVKTLRAELDRVIIFVGNMARKGEETEMRMMCLEEELLIATGKREVEEHRRAVAEKAKRAEDQKRVVQEEQAAQLAALVHSLQRDVQILEEKVCVEMKSLRAALEAAGAEKTKLEQTVVRSSVLLEKQARMVKELPTAVYV